jgi:hypothetical protein
MSRLSGDSLDEEGGAWADRADDLARWALARLVNRVDVWGGYRPDEEIGREFTRADGTKGRLGAQKTVRGRLAHDRLLRHFRARGRNDILGLHAASAENLGSWGAVDVDWHGPQSTAPDVNQRASLSWYAELVRRGFRPILTTSNNAGGFHLRVLLASRVPAERLFHFLKILTANHRHLGLPAAPEQFPKQPDVRACKKKLGNWLRCPGKHHRHDRWSQVWDGRTWLAGAEAVAYILDLKGDSPALIPVETPPPAPPAPARRWAASRTGGGGNLASRIAGRMARLPHLQEGQGRTRVAFSFAAWLARDLARPDDIALGWLEQWDAGNSPPLGPERLREILADAHTYGTSAYGSGLEPERPRRDRHGHTILSCELEV